MPEVGGSGPWPLIGILAAGLGGVDFEPALGTVRGGRTRNRGEVIRGIPR